MAGLDSASVRTRVQGGLYRSLSVAAARVEVLVGEEVKDVEAGVEVEVGSWIGTGKHRLEEEKVKDVERAGAVEVSPAVGEQPGPERGEGREHSLCLTRRKPCAAESRRSAHDVEDVRVVGWSA